MLLCSPFTSENTIRSSAYRSVEAWARRDRSLHGSLDDEDLLVFGYTSRIYPADERSDFIAEERHLITSPNDPSLRIDRCIFLFGFFPSFPSQRRRLV
ncbi:unnamed protein product [Haemonchus placei]|uniref:DUF4158 domain-containing protein n=1 Tax=Haemonchus placei TaxID=6290 RepID=A0A0N4WW53_HAEPC|nr:unnamed protein product [Haemonchus placei]